MNRPWQASQSKRLIIFFVPIVIGLIAFALYQNSQIFVTNSSYQNQLTSIVDSDNQSSGNNAQSGIASSNNANMNVASTTFTQQVAMKLYYDSLLLQQSGTDNLGNLQSLVLNTANDALANTASDLYTEGDLKIMPSPTDDSAILSFANNFLLISNQVSQQLANTDMANKLNDPSSPDFGIIMTTISKIYSDYAKNMVTIPIPQEIDKSYLLLANNYAHLSEDYAGVGAENNDPLLAVIAINRIKSDEAQQQTIAQTLGDYLQAHGIVYSSSLGSYTIKSK
jgi:hypothetical protein